MEEVKWQARFSDLMSGARQWKLRRAIECLLSVTMSQAVAIWQLDDAAGNDEIRKRDDEKEQNRVCRHFPSFSVIKDTRYITLSQV